MDTYNLKRRLKNLDQKVAELQESNATLVRKSTGIDRANRIINRHERGIARLTEEVQGLSTRMDNLGVDNPAQAKAWNRELTRLEKLLTEQSKKWVDLEEEILQIKSRQDEESDRNDTQDKRLDDHDLKFASYGERIEGVEVTAGAHASAIASLQSESRDRRAHPLAWVFGIIAGILAGWAWAVHDWAEVTISNGAQTVVENTAANSWPVAVLAGVSAGGLAWGFFAYLLPSRSEDQAQVSTASASSGAGARVVIDRDAPTMAVPIVNATPPPPPVANRNAGVY